MIKEKEMIMRIISDHINKRKSECPSEMIDWEIIKKISIKQQIAGIIYIQCKDFIPATVCDEFKLYYHLTVYAYIKRQNINSKIIKQLENQNIPAIIVKGTEIAKYYPCPQLRTMGDTDIVVHTKDRSKAAEVLKDLGLVNLSCRNDKEWIYCYESMEYELHNKLVYNTDINNIQTLQFFNNVWDYVKDGELDKSFHLLFLILHLRGHFMMFGVGFRQFIDIAVICKYCKEINWLWIKEQLNNIKMNEFASVCFSLIKRWFDIDIPYTCEELKDEFYYMATNAIFDNGVFGYDNESNEKNIVINSIRNNKKIGMIKKIIEYVFPPYQMIKDQAYYSYIDSKPYLLPVAWIHRLVRGAKYFEKSKIMLKKLVPAQKEILDRDEYLKKWGL